VLTKSGPVEIDVPRDPAGTFEPMVVRKRRLGSIADIVLSLSARGMTRTGASPRTWPTSTAPRCPKTTISTITDKVLVGMSECQNGLLDPVYPVEFVDCIDDEVRVGQVADRRSTWPWPSRSRGWDILGRGRRGGAKYWQQVLTEIRIRDVES
jgi:transposase-like protein